MTGDPINIYRLELRRAAARHIRSHQRRRRAWVTLAVGVAALLLVGGAIGAQTRWLSAPSVELRLATRACVTVRPLRVWTTGRGRAALWSCGANVVPVAVVCRVTASSRGRLAGVETLECTPAGERRSKR